MNANVIGSDVSFYQDDPATPLIHVDFSKMAERATFVIIRAGQSNYADRDFKANWLAAKGILPRGSYWFYDSRTSPKVQADIWANQLAEDSGELPLFPDFEERYGGTYTGYKYWIEFIELLQDRLPQKEIMIYTAYYYWLENTVQKGIPIEKLAWFGKFPLWIANYGVEKPLIPKPWTSWTFWQFTDSGDGDLHGVESKEIDLNYFNGDQETFNQRFKLSGQIHIPIRETEYQKIRRFDSDCHIVMADLNKYHALVTNTDGYLRTVSSMAEKHKASIALNGDGLDKTAPFPHYPLSIAASNGNVYQRSQLDYRPFLNVTKDGRIQIAWNDLSELHNTVSGTRFVLQNGVKNPNFDSLTIEYLEKHPRTCAGRRADGRLILLVVDGRSENNAGVTLSELAEIMLETGAVDAIEFDGGGSSALWYGDKIVNIPSDGQERAVVNHLVLMEKEIPMTRYTMTPIASGTRLRTDHNQYAGIIDVDTTISNVQSFNAGDLLEGDQLWVAPSDGSEVKAGDKWVHVTKRNGANLLKPGWTAFIHKGLPICKNFTELADTPDLPPTDPTVPVPPFDLHVHWDSVKFTVTFNGKELVEKVV